MQYDFELVGKIGSMALIRQRGSADIDYNIFSRLGRELKPRHDLGDERRGGNRPAGLYQVARGTELTVRQRGCRIRPTTRAQGQSILMEQLPPLHRGRNIPCARCWWSISHFNDPEKREHIRRLLPPRERSRARFRLSTTTTPFPTRKTARWELSNLRREHRDVVHECVDNDETAAVIAGLVTTKMLLIMTSTEGIYRRSERPEDAGARRDWRRRRKRWRRKIRELQHALHGRVPRGRERRVCQAGICARNPCDARHDGDYRSRPSPHQRSGGGPRALHEDWGGIMMKANYHTHTARCGHAERHGRGICAGGDRAGI